MSDLFNWFCGVTRDYVSASTLPASGPPTLAGEGEANVTPVASPSFQGLTIENLVSTVERIQK